MHASTAGQKQTRTEQDRPGAEQQCIREMAPLAAGAKTLANDTLAVVA
jgi:hypothetical protein